MRGKGPETWADATHTQNLALLLKGLSATVDANAQITKLGARQLHELGYVYGRRYARHNLVAMSARSTPENSSVASAAAFFTGLHQANPALVPTPVALTVEPRLAATFAPPEDVAAANDHSDTPIALHLLREHEDLIGQLGIHYSGSTPKDFMEAAFRLHDCMQVSYCWGKMWAWPRSLQQSDIRKELLELKLQYVRQRNGIRLPSGLTRAETMTRAVLREAFSRAENGGIHVYSGDEQMIFALHSALQLQNLTYMPFASHLTLELYEDIRGDKRVAVLFNGELQQSRLCRFTLCYPEEFLPEAPLLPIQSNARAGFPLSAIAGIIILLMLV